MFYAEQVVSLEEPHPSQARGYVYLGVGYSLCAEESKLQHDRHNYQKQAMNAFIKYERKNCQRLSKRSYLSNPILLFCVEYFVDYFVAIMQMLF